MYMKACQIIPQPLEARRGRQSLYNALETVNVWSQVCLLATSGVNRMVQMHHDKRRIQAELMSL